MPSRVFALKSFTLFELYFSLLVVLMYSCCCKESPCVCILGAISQGVFDSIYMCCSGMRPTVILALRVLQLGVQETSGDGNGGDSGEEILCIRAFGVSYMAVSTSIRCDRLTLLSSPYLALQSK